jgi:hypothetical protein
MAALTKPDEPFEMYIGDGVYAAYEDESFTLTTHVGPTMTNIICLSKKTIDTLNAFVKQKYDGK